MHGASLRDTRHKESVVEGMLWLPRLASWSDSGSLWQYQEACVLNHLCTCMVCGCRDGMILTDWQGYQLTPNEIAYDITGTLTVSWHRCFIVYTITLATGQLVC
jgi:hypothetical protein